MPDIRGHELAIGDELGHELPPDCCDTQMTKKTDTGDLEYVCRWCKTVLEVDRLGLVFDIREKQTA
jgi:hypothetical protein